MARSLRILAAALVGLTVVACESTTAASPSPNASASPLPTPAQTASPIAVPAEPTVVFFARIGLPPLAATVPGHGGGRNLPEDRIGNRISALWGAQQAPPDAFNVFAVTGRTSSGGQLETSVRIVGDLATVAFKVSSWGVTTEAAARALIQQLVYTVSEESGIRRVLIAEEGKPTTVIAGVAIDKPLTREDVAGYSFSGTKTSSIRGDGTQVAEDIVSWSVTNEQTPGLGRFAVDLRARGAVPGERLDPRFSARLERCDGCGGAEGKWWIILDLLDVPPTRNWSALGQQPTGGPIRAVSGPPVIDSLPQGLPNASFSIRVDDGRPWRVSVEPTGSGTARLYVDVGGRPSTVSESIAVYLPVPEQGAGDRATGCTCKISGAARVFEASVAWRVRDGNGREVSRGGATASRGTSQVWGVFETTFTIPPNIVGTPTLEVFRQSPLDGSDRDVVAIPLTLH